MERQTILVKKILSDFHQKLSAIYPDREIQQFIYILFEAYLGWPKARIHLSLDSEIPGTAAQSFTQALEELYIGKPIQYVLKTAWFNGIRLKVDSNVLIPRPETEELCSIIKADHQGKLHTKFSILDIGTGSGCIAIDLKKHFPHGAVTALDNAAGALEIAGENAMSSNCAISFVHADILDQSGWAKFGKYDLIVSNPPYVLESEQKRMHRNVVEFEPPGALFVTDGDPLIFYSAIAGFAAIHLNPSARLYFEVNERFGEQVCQLVDSFGFEQVSILRDFQGKDRFVSAILNPVPIIPCS